MGRPSKAAPQLKPTIPQKENAGVLNGKISIANLPAQAAPVDARVFKGKDTSANRFAQAAPLQQKRHNRITDPMTAIQIQVELKQRIFISARAGTPDLAEHYQK